MANTIGYASIFQQNLDKQMTAKLTSGWMESNAGQVIYDGGKEVKIPHLSMQGLADYGRAAGTGFKDGEITFKYQTKEMRKDRGRSFQFDAHDVDETNFVLTAGNVLSVFQTTKVVPEIDAYRYSMIAREILIAHTQSGQAVKGLTSGTTGTGIAEGIVSENYAPNKSTIFSKVKADLAAIRDIVGDIPLVISMSSLALAELEQADEISRHLIVTDFEKGGIMTKVKSIDGVPIVEVPSSRMATEFEFKNDANGGFAKSAKGADINWIITPANGPVAVSKTDTVRIFTPETNQTAHAWKIDYRKYHDVWLTEEQVKLCRMSVKTTLTRAAKPKEETAE